MLGYVRNMTDSHTDFALGFVLGQAAAYIEQVIAGAKLAAQIGCATEHVRRVIEAAEQDGCHTMVEDRGDGRSGVWIFRSAFVRNIIEELGKQATPPTAAGVWAMGKLFGYSDPAIGEYLQAHKLITSASDSESSQRPYWGNGYLRTEQARCAY